MILERRDYYSVEAILQQCYFQLEELSREIRGQRNKQRISYLAYIAKDAHTKAKNQNVILVSEIATELYHVCQQLAWYDEVKASLPDELVQQLAIKYLTTITGPTYKLEIRTKAIVFVELLCVYSRYDIDALIQLKTWLQNV